MVDIPMMISYSSKAYFSSKAEAKEFLEKKNYNCGFEAFLSLFIKIWETKNRPIVILIHASSI